jgi:hypothetical protein
MYHTPETLLNHVFEDLRKPKAPQHYLIIRLTKMHVNNKFSSNPLHRLETLTYELTNTRRSG